jgi:hypothetical protein
MRAASAGRPLRRDMLPHPVDVRLEAEMASLGRATRLAQAKARELHPEVILLAWFDRQTGDYSPRITC